MAGSIQHVMRHPLDEAGPEPEPYGWRLDLIDNMGDAGEALEDFAEAFLAIARLARGCEYPASAHAQTKLTKRQRLEAILAIVTSNMEGLGHSEEH